VSYLGSHNLSGRVVFDPRNKAQDEPLLKALQEHLPLTPINQPLIPHQDTVVTVPPGKDVERLGERVKVEIATNSHQAHGLQVADFIAGDVRTFFSEVPELLSEATSDEPLVNTGILFPQLFRRSELSRETKQKLTKPGKSSVLLYRDRLVNNMVSCYANNGQMRNVNLALGDIYDIMD